jgi:hypothetical protein
VAVFLVGVVAGMALTQHLRSEGPVVSRIAMKTEGGPPYKVCFQTPRDDTYRVGLVDAGGEFVRELADGVFLEGDPAAAKESAHCFKWNGLDEDGVPVSHGPYRLYLELEDVDREVVSGEKLKITPENAP